MMKLVALTPMSLAWLLGIRACRDREAQLPEMIPGAYLVKLGAAPSWVSEQISCVSFLSISVE